MLKKNHQLLFPRFFKKVMGILQSPPSVHPSVRPSVTLSRPKPLDEIQPNLVCELLTWMGCATAQFFWPRNLGPWGGAKRSNIIKFLLQSQFQIFLNQTLFVFSQMKDIKHIRRDFHSVAWVMPQGWDLGVLGGGWRGKKFIFSEIQQNWCVSYSHEWHMQRHNFFGPRPLGPWGGAKRSNIIKVWLQSQFQIFLNQTLCVFSQMKDIKHIRRDFHSVAWVIPQGWDLGLPGVWGVKNLFFPKFN